jgi:hypothetical protein
MLMQKRTHRTKIVAAVASAALAIVVSPAAGVGTNDGLHGDSSVAFWPHETGALVGTSETYIDVRADGSYFDPSVGRRVAPANVE